MFVLRIHKIAIIVAVLLAQGMETVAQSDDFNPDKELQNIINYLEFSQQKESKPPYYFKGEWPSYIENLKNFPLLGKKGKKAYDSNCMLNSIIFNILAEYSIKNLENNQTKKLLENAISNFENYKVGDVYHFWHNLERAEHLRTKEKDQCYQRRANNFHYKSKLLNNMMNITPDLDDASSVWLSYYLYDSIFQIDSILMPISPGEYLDAFSDINRKSVHFYNQLYGHGRETGAFLTWFREEERTGLRYVFPGEDYYIPFGVNDKDAVVNANILYSLTVMNDTLFPSYRNSADFINSCFEKKKSISAGNYYPTRYSLHYSASKAYWKGCSRLKRGAEIIYSDLRDQQLANGSYPCEIKGNENQATIFALNSMIYLKLAGFEELDNNIIKAFDYVMSKKNSDNNQCWWTGGVCWSAGTFARKSHVWKSDAYTSALMLEAISNYFDPS